MGSECHHVSEILIYLQHFSNKFDDFCVKLLLLMITFGGMILLKMLCPALPGMIKTFLDFSHSKITLLPVEVKGLECAGSKLCCV
jgi:hypothetical protein